MSLPEHDHETWADATGAYVLRAMPTEELDAYERHLRTCAVCRDEVEDLRVAADSLALAAPPVEAPDEVRSRLMLVVEQEAGLLRAAGPQADRPERAPARRRRWSAGFGSLLRPAFALPAVLAVLVVGALTGVGAAGLLGGEDRPAARSLTAEVSERVAPNARATLEWRGMNAVLVAERLPAPPEGRVYQVWVKRPNLDPEPTSTLFTPRSDGSAAAAVPGPLEGMEAVLVSHEPSGGSPSPTSAVVVSVDLSS